MPQNSSSHKNFPPRICIKFREGINISYGDQDELHDYISKNKILPLKKLQEQYKGIEIGKYFTSVEPQRIRELLKEAKENHYTGRRNKKSDRPLREYEPPRLFSYCAMDCPYGTDVTALQRSLLKYPDVEIAYVEGGPCPPPAVNAANDPRAGNQHHLDPSPIGIDARFAWTQTGGNGASTVKFVDIENGWTLNHEDLPRSGINLLSGVNHSSKGHGTSVLGVVLAKDNTIGGIGITPSVKANVISAFRTAIVYNIADAILSAVDVLNFGDILLLEAQTTMDNQTTYLPVEAEPAIFDVIYTASSKLVVIEAAGNGNQNGGRNLDTWSYPGTRKFVLNRTSGDLKDSGAVMVAAATSAVPHRKTTHSNFGSRIDCFAWGENINTSGDGGDGNSTTAYTTAFNGTSGASAIIAGAAVAVQSMSDAMDGSRFYPESIREILSDTSYGTMPAAAETHKIGVMPDLKKIYNGEFISLS